MKHLNRKIALLAFILPLAIGQSMANEPGLSSINSSAEMMVMAGNKEGGNKGRGGRGGHGGHDGNGRGNQCDLPSGDNGKLCKTGECVVSRKMCPRKNPSPAGG